MFFPGRLRPASRPVRLKSLEMISVGSFNRPLPAQIASVDRPLFPGCILWFRYPINHGPDETGSGFCRSDGGRGRPRGGRQLRSLLLPPAREPLVHCLQSPSQPLPQSSILPSIYFFLLLPSMLPSSGLTLFHFADPFLSPMAISKVVSGAE